MVLALMSLTSPLKLLLLIRCAKLIVRTEQNNFAGGGTVAGLVPWAPVAARRAEVRTSRSMWNKCFGRRKRTTIFCTGCWGLAKTPRGRSAALSGELGGAERSAEPRGEVPRRRRCPRSVCGGRGAVGGRTATSAALRGRKWHFLDDRSLVLKGGLG